MMFCRPHRGFDDAPILVSLGLTFSSRSPALAPTRGLSDHQMPHIREACMK